MIDRIIALVILICLFSVLPASAVEEENLNVESSLFEAEVPLEDGDTGVEGLEIDDGLGLENASDDFLDDDALMESDAYDYASYAINEGMPQLYSVPERSRTASEMVLDRKSVSLVPGSSVKIKASYKSGYSCNAVWTTEDSSVAVADASGIITAVGIGETVVSASDEYGVSAQCRVTVSDEIKSVSFDCSTFYLGVGETTDALRVDINDGRAEILDGYKLSAAKNKYVRVNKDGTIKGLKKGSATVTATADNGLTDKVKVVVGTAPTKITASPKKVTIGVGEQTQLGYKLPKGSYGGVVYKSQNTACVTVDPETGVVMGLKPGTAKVKITTYNKKSCTVTVKVAKAPKNLSLSEHELLLGKGMTDTLKASLDADSAGNIVWESSDTSVVKVEKGKVTAVKPGSAEIYARTYVNGVSDVCTVEVLPAPEAVVLPSSKIYIGVGEKIQLTPDVGESVGGFTYSSSKKEFATVSAAGVVKGKKAGTTSITVKTYNGKKAKVKVVVGKAPKKITASNLSLGLGEAAVLQYKLTSGSYGAVTFKNMNPECVRIDSETGSIETLKTGSAVIELSTYNGKKTKATVKVLEAPSSVSMSQNQLIIGAGQSVDISASVNDGAASAITWKSGDAKIASVNAGKIKGVAPGTAEIFAETYVEGVSGVCNVLVKSAPTKVTLNEKKVYIGVGDSYLIEADVGDSVGGFKYSSADKKIAKVSADGVVKGVKAGTVKITVKTYNGKKAALTVVVRKAPKKITPKEKNLELGVGESFVAGYKLPSKTSTTVTFTSLDESIAKVNSKTGKITAIKPGKTQVRMRTHNGKEALVEVGVYPAPEWLKMNRETLDMGVGQVFALKPSIPEDSRSAISYSSSDESIVKVKADGSVTAVAKGSAKIRVETCSKDVFAVIPVKVMAASGQVSLKAPKDQLSLNETMQLETIVPDGTMAGFTYKSSKTAVAIVSEDGMVTAVNKGEATITVTTHNGHKATVKIKVFDPEYPEKLTLTNLPGVMWEGGKAYQLEYTVEPSEAVPLIKWTSSKPEVATIDQNGLITPVSFGYTTIRGVSQKNSSAKIEFSLAVQEKDRILVIPERTTQENGISQNLRKIEDIRKSAIAQVDALRSKGTIKAKDASKRKDMINNIFRDYAFAWKTPSLQKYWRKANSEGGAKDFKADRVYYGMPYISGSGENRTYSSTKALKEKRYTDSGKGYYLLNKKKLLNGKYVGSDCSGLVNAAIWGHSSSHINDRTVEIAESKAYKTIKGYDKMRPGDLLCLGYRHVVMFLYYADDDKSKIMIIENGGAEAGTNTVHCAVHNVSYYKKNGYAVRRLATLG